MTSTAERILAIDQGTGSTKAILVDREGRVTAEGRAPLRRRHPHPGWTEQSGEEILHSVHQAVHRCFESVPEVEVVAIGLSTQRESMIAWDRRTGESRSPVISWQDQRTQELCRSLRDAGHEEEVRRISGLPIDPMFSATRARWLLDEIDPDREQAGRGDLCVGTIDAWLLRRLTGSGLTEIGNASRTQLLNLDTGNWSPELADLFRVPLSALPAIRPSTGPFGTAAALPGSAGRAPITGVLGDSHAALFSHAGWRAGVVKATYGTGTSLMGVEQDAAPPGPQVCRTIAWGDGQEFVHAVEGNIRSSGDTLQWLSELVGRPPSELAELAETASSDGVHLVPAFNGLGAPWWSSTARGVITGVRRDTGAGQLARAALEAIALQVEDVATAFEHTTGPIATLVCDGAASANVCLMQLQADVSGRTIERAMQSESSALGAAQIAGLSFGWWTYEDLERRERLHDLFTPRSDAKERAEQQRAWHDAIRTAIGGQPLTPSSGPT